MDHSPKCWIERVKVVNFKSFAGEHLFRFDPGFSVLVGANGVGKSNVFDAILFALGEKLATCRAEKLIDLICERTNDTQAVCAVEVSIRQVQPDLLHGNSLTVSAQVIGQQCERGLDGKPATLKRVHEVVRSLGLVPECAPYFIRQAAISCAMDTKLLTSMLHNAAGCTHYINNREHMLLRIATEENRLKHILEKVRELDAITEASSRSYEVLADIAAREDLKAMIGELGGHIRAATADLECHEADQRIKSLLAHSVACRASSSCFARELSTVEEDMQRADDEHRTSSNAVENAKDEVEILVDQLDQDEKSLLQAALLHACLSADLAQAREQRSAAQVEEDKVAYAVLTSERRLRELQSVRAELRERWRQHSTSSGPALGSAQAERAFVDLELSKAVRRLEGATRAVDDARLQHGRAVHLITQAEERINELEARYSGVRGVLVDSLADPQGLEAICADLELEVQALGDELAEAEDSRRLLHATQASMASPTEHGVTIFDAMSPSDAFLREWRVWGLPMHVLLKPSYKILVVQTTHVAKEVLTRAREAGTTVRIWPMDRLVPQPWDAIRYEQKQCLDDLGLAEDSYALPLDLIRVDDHLNCALAALGRAVLVDTHATAEKILQSAQCPHIRECITTEGVRHGVSTVSGGRHGAVDVVHESVLAKAFSREADTVVKALSDEVRRAEDELRLGRSALDAFAVEDAVRLHRRSLEEKAANLELLQENLDECRLREAACAQRRDVLAHMAMPTLWKEMRKRARHESWVPFDADAVGEELTAYCNSEATALQAAIDAKGGSAELISPLELEDRIVAVQDGMHSASKARETVVEDIALHEVQLDGAATELEEAMELSKESRATANAMRREASALFRSRAALDRELQKSEAAVHTLRAKLQSLPAANNEAQSVEDVLFRHQRPVANLSHRMRTAEGAREGTDLSAMLRLAGDVHKLLQRSPADLTERINGLRTAADAVDRQLVASSADLKALSSVHGTVDREHMTQLRNVVMEQRGRQADLTQRRAVVQSSLRQLQVGLQESDARSRSLLLATCERVRKSFSQAYAAFVPTKEADLIADEPLEPGQIRFRPVVRAVGSTTWDARQLSALSGGQHSLLNFCLMLSNIERGGGLVLMDEIDAALDERNAELAARYLCDLARSKSMQVVAISHREEFHKAAAARVSVLRRAAAA